jgi:ribonuclease P protein component
MTVSKKVGNAVERNGSRGSCEFFGCHKSGFRISDIVIIAKRKIAAHIQISAQSWKPACHRADV